MIERTIVFLNVSLSLSTVNGTFGEGILLTVDERKQLAEKWIEAAKNRYK